MNTFSRLCNHRIGWASIFLFITILPISVSARKVTNFDSGWRFMLADDKRMSDKTFDDSSWRLLDLPHDWAIEGDFSAGNPSGAGGGALPGGVGWYRKSFRVESASPEQKHMAIRFDGVYMNSTVWINGHKLGTRPYGYISFEYDLTPFIIWGGENVIAVKVDNSDQPNSRWYSGCGIYRHVWLVETSLLHIDT